ncbi:DASH complex subunit dam1 [Tilletia horrida]|uniref:DASH complex subunit DAM1 n=1 Tax=Tilletia horrida TaxID=155126 RepID=A0AAN6JYD1_9BASI|nr:DASH complex subunit dam1 [Tilletia horrida]KAK0552163.1 DASH complex subunit dam1 [Tilletia horrida]
MTSPHRPSTPLRRISRGSIPALRQSQSHIDASGLDDADNGEGSSHHHLLSSIGGAGGALGNLESPLAFMKAAMGDLDHETSILQSNLEAVNSIHAALAVFDENFSMYLYGLKMNAFCVEWAEAPTEENFQRAEQTQDVLRAQRQQQSSILAGEPLSHLQSGCPDQGQLPASGEGGLADAIPPQEPPTSAFQSSTTASGPSSQSRASQAGPSAAAAPKKVGAKGQITMAQKKQRIKYASDIIDTLPLEYRGGRDPKPRKIAETVILALIAAGPAGVRTAEIASPPDLPQGKVNMTLLALVQAKHAIRTSSNGVVFSLDPTRHPRLPA